MRLRIIRKFYNKNGINDILFIKLKIIYFHLRLYVVFIMGRVRVSRKKIMILRISLMRRNKKKSQMHLSVIDFIYINRHAKFPFFNIPSVFI